MQRWHQLLSQCILFIYLHYYKSYSSDPTNHLRRRPFVGPPLQAPHPSRSSSPLLCIISQHTNHQNMPAFGHLFHKSTQHQCPSRLAPALSSPPSLPTSCPLRRGKSIQRRKRSPAPFLNDLVLSMWSSPRKSSSDDATFQSSSSITPGVSKRENMVLSNSPKTLTILQVSRLRIIGPAHNRKFNLIKALALESCALLQSLLCVGKFFTLRSQLAHVPSFATTQL